ncbi:SusC/RagA family TonB-linked outer membrane protein [Hymenobacter sp.]|uniref:SusC/RagA family TonB-linked outer membrane protein n=1 Tax=Hymenobacter sp. TaxID=1898978 RepID=UPI00286A16DB|nr:SusC/RagA family TonB-linked outer membrane protein [Hymenobacter sp.]
MTNNWYTRYKSAEPAAAAPVGRSRPALLRVLALGILSILLPLLSQAQANRAVSGKVTDAQSAGLPGVTVLVPGSTVGTSTGADGSFQLQVPEAATTLTLSFVGYATQQVDITGKTTVQVAMKEDAQGLGEVVVVGYGTARKQDVTGAVAVLGEKDFNRGTFTSPDQLLQGRVSGVQVSNNSGQPGGPATIRIRGNSAVTGTGQPLYVVDGVPLDGRTARPGIGAAGTQAASTDIGAGADSNPLNFLNPDDIETFTVLKDASATAIYGSRAAYGVVLITTKKGKTGAPVLSVGASTGFSTLLRRPEFLDAGQYRQAITYYNVPSSGPVGSSGNPDKGGDVDALDEILRTGSLQNYNVSMSGGGETGRYRLSLGYLDQDGIVRKTGFKKYSANLSTNLQFLESKKLGVDVNIATSQFREELANITTDAGFRGSLIGQALQWNPTQSLRNPDGSLFIQPGDVVNPLAAQELYDDNSRVNTVLASIAPSYKFTDWLNYRLLLSVNYNSGERRTAIDQRLINLPGIRDQGFANISNSELSTQQIVHTLNFNKAVVADLNLNAVLGYEYTNFINKGSSLSGFGNAAAGGFGSLGLDYTDYIQTTAVGNRSIRSFNDPTYELQSFFGRAIFNYKDRYVLTGTLRRDESSKFGANNRVGYFPSFAAAWDLSRESFFPTEQLTQLKLRAGYGLTGNQEFPAGAAVDRFEVRDNGEQRPLNSRNEDLKWQSDRQFNVGIDIGAFNNRLTFSADYFNKTTTDILFPTIPGRPSPQFQAIFWDNLDGKIVNKGVEMAVNTTLLSNEKAEVSFNANATFIRNEVKDLVGPEIITGAINGQGLSGATAQLITNGYPINAFFLPQYNGLDDRGISNPFGPAAYASSPNPRTLLGFGLNARYSKLSLVANMTGVFGQYIYNNTLNAVGAVGGIGAGKNIAVSTFENPVKEAPGNAGAASTRYLEKGDFLKMSNLTLSYALGDVAGFMKGARVYATGQNLFVITDYDGFDPEVNTVKTGDNKVPSVGIDYLPYPSARTFTFGVNFNL